MNTVAERIGTCRSCGAPIIRIKSVKANGKRGKTIALDADPIGRRLVRFGANGELVRYAQTWVAHSTTCTSSAKWKQKQGR